MYTLSQDDILENLPPRVNPEPIESHRGECREFFQHAYGAVSVILNHLDRHLGLRPGTLAALSPLDKPSATALRLLRSPAQLALDPCRIDFGGHTDIGTTTLLFNVAGGLQVLPAGSENVNENWRYIRPQQGCALINVADTLTGLDWWLTSELVASRCIASRRPGSTTPPKSRIFGSCGEECHGLET